jgi:hypothetical protein
MTHSTKSPTKGSCEHGHEIFGFAEAENFLPHEKLSTSEGRTCIIELVSKTLPNSHIRWKDVDKWQQGFRKRRS